ncbi:hypothetical protein SOVF_196000 [Spinacia oleracea]|nr:hypothetical protein SOVF_196000 [Spinacia oleracea]
MLLDLKKITISPALSGKLGPMLVTQVDYQMMLSHLTGLDEPYLFVSLSSKS